MGIELVVVHSGGGRAEALASQLRALGAQAHSCARITKAGERTDLVREDFHSLQVKVNDDTVTALLDAVGSDAWVGLAIAALCELTVLVLSWPELGPILPVARVSALAWLLVAGAWLPLRALPSY